ncbi:MAG TPA: DUF427 domain-containing protein [Candidatus Saccharimonadales bacterium]|nr:DUF427 domain-containing protein [Candidatus Saccharimonadales bacterium]
MKAVWNGTVIAEAPKGDLIFIERNWYFPPSSVNWQYLRASQTPYTCYWKGTCQYYDVGEGGSWSNDSAWAYPDLKASAIERVGKDFSNYVAFWRDTTITE